MIEVTGGAGGVTADLEAMLVTGRRLMDAAAEVGELSAVLTGIAADTDLLATALLDPAGWADSQRRMGSALTGPVGLLALAARTAALAAAVQAAAAAYATAEDAVDAAITAVRDRVAGSAGQLTLRLTTRYPVVVVPAALVAGQAVLLWRTGDLAAAALADAAGDAADGSLRWNQLDDRTGLLALQVAARLRGDADTAGTAALGWLARHPALAEHAVAATPSLLAGLAGVRTSVDVGDLAFVTVLLGYGTGVLGRGRVGVRLAAATSVRPAAAPRGVADLVGRAVALAPPRRRAVPEARIRIERIRTRSGPASVVYVPGTQTWSLGGSGNPMDATSNLDAMAGRRSAAQSAVLQALRAAEVGADEPLLLVGYSQGGLTSMALASDPAFTREFSPQAVLTVGAPVAGFSPPDGVAVLSLEHAEDLVTALDGAPNPDRPQWTTVRRRVLDPDSGDPLVAADMADHPTAAHRREAYLRTARQVDVLDHRSLEAWRRHARPFLGGGTSATSEWVAVRDTGSG